MTEAPAASEPDPLWITVKADDLRKMTIGQLQKLADHAGIGYTKLDEESLRQKLILEGTPSQ